MPHTIHEGAARKQFFLNVSRPQEVVPENLPENWTGTLSQGLPVKAIPHYEYPRVVYAHPNRPTRTVLHRNERREVVHEEEIQNEHLSKLVGCEAHMKSGGPKECRDCKKALEAALAEGWVLEPYIPEARPKPDADLYRLHGNAAMGSK